MRTQERSAACKANQLELILRAMEATLFVLNPSRNLFTLSMVPFGDTVVQSPFSFFIMQVVIFPFIAAFSILNSFMFSDLNLFSFLL